MKKDNRNYYIYFAEDMRNHVWKEVKGYKVVVPGFEDFDLFAYKTQNDRYGGWIVSEGQTGMSVGTAGGKTLKEAKACVTQRLARVSQPELKDMIQRGIEISGLSPRYNGKTKGEIT